ncbi:hypothetical protein T069G_06431 [Trichoderma breve]|uniref:Uncharacterized protein n=1 Tax=Trichoderma breve TaxID=2034170 RepID=A0A9W9B901_9HYPO|nr:hypothetical protein T069G_06431 [Trichoderma breve]KAJ4858164.1 hypothetical protein T069G_06431 [Trichoderma breve]
MTTYNKLQTREQIKIERRFIFLDRKQKGLSKKRAKTTASPPKDPLGDVDDSFQTGVVIVDDPDPEHSESDSDDDHTPDDVQLVDFLDETADVLGTSCIVVAQCDYLSKDQRDSIVGVIKTHHGRVMLLYEVHLLKALYIPPGILKELRRITKKFPNNVVTCIDEDILHTFFVWHDLTYTPKLGQEESVEEVWKGAK